MTSLLIDESPMLLSPTLACLLGDRHAILLQQIHYWCSHYKRAGDPRHFHAGRWWIYNALPAWHDQFPWWSESTIRRIIKDLRHKGILLISRYNLRGYDQTRWYTIDYQRLDELIDAHDRKSRPSAQNEQMDQLNLSTCMRSNRPDGSAQNGQMDLLNLSGPIPETTRETATDNATTLWTNALSELALQMTHTTFDTWLRGTALQLHDHTATVLCPNEYTREWLATRLDPPITRTLRALTQTADLQIAYSTASLGGSEEHHQ